MDDFSPVGASVQNISDFPIDLFLRVSKKPFARSSEQSFLSRFKSRGSITERLSESCFSATHYSAGLPTELCLKPKLQGRGA